MRRLIAASCAAFGLCLTLGTVASADAGAPALPLSLDAALALALDRNPGYRISHADALASRAALQEANGPRLPTATLSDAVAYASPVAELNTPFGPLPFSSTTMTNVPLLDLRYRVYDGGATAARVSYAAAGVAEADAGERSARATLIDATAAAYFDLAAAVASAEVADHALDLARSHERDAQQLLAAGQVPRADVLSAQADVAGRRMQQLRAHHAVDLAQVGLDDVLGLPLDVLHVPTDPLDAAAPDIQLETMLAAARATRGDVAAARAAIDAASFALDEARAGRAPHVELDVADGNVQPAVVPGYRNQVSVGLTAVWTLFDNGATSGRIDAARAGIDRAKLALEQRRREAEREVRDAYLAMSDARAQVDAARAYVASADESLHLAQVRYRGGVGTQLELQDAEVRAATAEQSLVAAEVAVRKSVVHARFAAGLL